MGPTTDAVLAAIAELAFDIVIVLGQDGTVTWRHRSDVRRPGGVLDEQVVGSALEDRIHPDDLPDVLDGLAQLGARTRSETFHECRVFDEVDPSILHQVEVRAFDAQDVPGVEGTLILATVHDSRTTDRGAVGAADSSLADVMPLGIAVIAGHGRVIYANDLSTDLVGLIAGSQAETSSIPDLGSMLAETREAGSAQRTIRPSNRVLRVVGRRLDGSNGHVVMSVEDITAETDAVEARLLSEQVLRATFEHTPAGIALVKPSGHILDVNPAWLGITGFSREELIGEPLAKITDPDENDLRLVEALIARRRESFRVEKLYRHRTGDHIWVDLWVSLVRDTADRPDHFVCQAIDITKAKRLEAELLEQQRDLTHRATHDHLTGLANRAFFEENLRVAISRAKRGIANVAVLLLDLDRFKPINDTLGHQAGDDALREIAQRLVGECRDGDVVARLGGDEFGVIAEATDMSDSGHRLAVRLVERLAEPLESVRGQPSVSASIGITTLFPGDTVEAAMRRADNAVYTAKYRGGNECAHAGDPPPDAPERPSDGH